MRAYSRINYGECVCRECGVRYPWVFTVGDGDAFYGSMRVGFDCPNCQGVEYETNVGKADYTSKFFLWSIE